MGSCSASKPIPDGTIAARLPASRRDFTWCQRTRQERSRRGAFSSTLSILSNQRGEAVYVNRIIEPAFFGSSDISSEIARLSTRFGERARETRIPPREDAPSGVIAVWGKLQLEPVDGAALAMLGAGDALAQNLLIDPLGDPKRSLEMGLPVYRLGGGAGYLWSAAHTNGRGHLRFLTADPSALVVKTTPAGRRQGEAEAGRHRLSGDGDGWNGRGGAGAGTYRRGVDQHDGAGEVQARLCRSGAPEVRDRSGRPGVRAAGAGIHR